MNYLDIGVILVLAYNTFMGLRKGLIGILFDVVAMVSGISLAVNAYQPFGTYIGQLVHIPAPLNFVVAFALLWGTIFFSISLLGRLFSKASRMSFLGPLNILGGIFLGVLKGVCFLLPILVPMVYFQAQAVRDSVVLKPFLPAVGFLTTQYIPKSLLDLKPATPSGNSQSQFGGIEGFLLQNKNPKTGASLGLKPEQIEQMLKQLQNNPDQKEALEKRLKQSDSNSTEDMLKLLRQK